MAQPRAYGVMTWHLPCNLCTIQSIETMTWLRTALLRCARDHVTSWAPIVKSIVPQNNSWSSIIMYQQSWRNYMYCRTFSHWWDHPSNFDECRFLTSCFFLRLCAKCYQCITEEVDQMVLHCPQLVKCVNTSFTSHNLIINQSSLCITKHNNSQMALIYFISTGFSYPQQNNNVPLFDLGSISLGSNRRVGNDKVVVY